MLSQVPAGPAPLQEPDIRGRFGDFGGRFVPETLVQALQQLAEAYKKLREDSSFWQELADLMGSYSGRPTPLYRARRLQQAVGERRCQAPASPAPPRAWRQVQG